ncbi:MAG TPA: OmpH family outer membrane protein [Spirochaetota bacterium]|nr:OmpH family outer membrane protein [Spirochaetota bacterium]HOM10737.1 OmpH family outer membrane protein [Spirochaetota bacterium]HPP50087.1 OmpH family outer membrane protein [Spirochaetota bacterium]HXK65338.1 OmpH family outer membrane protein [Spirochaetota bacterium]
MKRFVLFILCLLIVSCQTVDREDSLTIRYVQLPILYNYMIQTSPDALSLQKRYNELKAQLDVPSVSDAERKDLAVKLQSIADQMDKQKKIFLTDIQQAIATVAKRKGYQIVLGGGDTVVYAKDGYDITSEILKELAALRLQKSPAAR